MRARVLPNLIVGGDSSVGRALGAYWKSRKIKFRATTRRANLARGTRPLVDLAIGNWDALGHTAYNSVVICAGISNVAKCDENPRESGLVNVERTVSLATYLASYARFTLFLSSSQVFDGSTPDRRSHDPTCPITCYGQQKAEAEKVLLGLGRVAVLRLTKIEHPGWSLIQNWTRDLILGREIEAFVDRRVSPVLMPHVIAKIDQLTTTQRPGIFHLKGSKELSYYDFALKVAEHLGLDHGLVVRKECPANLEVPHYASLSED